MDEKLIDYLAHYREKISKIHDDRDLIHYVQKNYTDLTHRQDENLTKEMEDLHHREMGLTLKITNALYENTVNYDGERDKEWVKSYLQGVLAVEDYFRLSEDNIHQEIELDKGIWFVRQFISILKYADSIDEVIKDFKFREQALDYDKDYRARPAIKMARVILLQTEDLQ